MARASPLQVFVRFKQNTVFAGEDVDCTITFKNVAPKKEASLLAGLHGQRRRPRMPQHTPQHIPQHTRAASGPVAASVRSAGETARAASASKTVAALASPAADGPSDEAAREPSPNANRHQRRVSIISLGSPTQERHALKHALNPGHVEVRKGLTAARPSPASDHTSPVSPLSQTTTPANGAHTRNTSLAEPLGKLQGSVVDDVASPAPATPTRPQDTSKRPELPPAQTSYFGPAANGHREAKAEEVEARPKIYTAESLDDSPRESSDIYSLSNHSQDTVASELPDFSATSLLRNPLSRTPSLATRPALRKDETVLMGYVQLVGSFTLDGSLVSQSPFEEVKQRAVVGGQGGGGVVGVARPQRASGIWSSLSWGSIGETLGMMSSTPSSLKEMKGIAGQNSIPLLSTSKSILFVDLKLAPGESKCYSYHFKLPRGLPPTHDGRAIKVTYNIVIGTHRPGPRPDLPQSIKQVEIPFRVLSGVNAQGEHLGHDLMAPYIILTDQARTEPVGDPRQFAVDARRAAEETSQTSSYEDFATYVEQLLDRRRQNSSQGLLSPSNETGPRTPTSPSSPLSPSRRSSRSVHGPARFASAKDLIDEAVRSSTDPNSATYSSTSFTIARTAIPVATLTLSRAAVRMGDVVTCTIDFGGARLPCYALEVSLESSEKVAPSLALRSAPSVARATRKVWARAVENTIWTRRSVFRAEVPLAATPTFFTTGVSLEWCIRLELVVGLPAPAGEGQDAADAPQSPQSPLQSPSSPSPSPSPSPRNPRPVPAWASSDKALRVLDVAHVDDRGTVIVAKQYLPCESFEVEIPIRVFGAVAGTGGGGGAGAGAHDLEGTAV